MDRADFNVTRVQFAKSKLFPRSFLQRRKPYSMEIILICRFTTGRNEAKIQIGPAHTHGNRLKVTAIKAAKQCSSHKSNNLGKNNTY